jgi:hypothetical protein
VRAPHVLPAERAQGPPAVQLPVGTTVAGSTINRIVRSGARGRCKTPCGTTKPWRERADLSGPMQSHDLVGVGLKSTYLDGFGATKKYRGAESSFDWSLVREVVDFVRSSPVTPITGVEIVKDGTIQVGS